MVVTGEPEQKKEEERLCEDLTILSSDSDNDSSSDSAVKHLRGRWELASVLNFFNVMNLLSYIPKDSILPFSDESSL